MSLAFIDNPQAIYQFIDTQITDLVAKIKALDSQNLQLNDMQEDHQKSFAIIEALQQDIKHSIQQLKDNAEWQTFQIAFFGETNAGKSTIIDTLRILLKEPSKLEQQKKFQEIVGTFDISAEKFYQVKEELTAINQELKELNAQKDAISQQYSTELTALAQQEITLSKEWDTQIQTTHQQYNHQLIEWQTKSQKLERKIEKIKANMSWLMKIIYIFIRLDEQKELIALLSDIDDLQDEMDEKLSILQTKKEHALTPILTQKEMLSTQEQAQLTPILDSLAPKEAKQQALNQWLATFSEKKAQLLPYLDGQIIGDGRSDFTRDSTSYQFNINNYPVNMIDVPGIEGNEKVVQDEITKAVQKTHAVFYVTSKDAPPNEGTLSRIQSHLNDQTEVWAIYNKQITNPRQLNNKLIKSDDEQQALNELEGKLKETLGNHYRGLLVLAGLPAFFSQATCIEPFSNMYEQQKKFLDKTGKNDLYQFSQLETLNKALQTKIVGDVPAKIKNSNFNKVKVLINTSNKQLTAVHETYLKFEDDLIKKVQLAEQAIKNHFSDFDMQMRGKLNRLIDEYKQQVRNQAYKEIDKNISNDEFKSCFERISKIEIENFERKVKLMIETQAQDMEQNIIQTQQELQKQINTLGKEYTQYSILKNFNMALDFKIDNGINVLGLLGTGIGVAAAMWWNPVGWLAIGATVLGLFATFIKSIFSFFDDDYKKEQQRKNVDSNLLEIVTNIKTETSKSIKELNEKLNEAEQKILAETCNIAKPVILLNEDLARSIRSLKEISSQIIVH